MSMQGTVAYYRDLSSNANMNLIRTAKDDSAWTLSEEGYAELLKSQYESLGYKISNITAAINDDTYLGYKRRLITLDTRLSVNGVPFSVHQEQSVMLSDTNCYSLTVSYMGSYEQSDMDLMISQFVIK